MWQEAHEPTLVGVLQSRAHGLRDGKGAPGDEPKCRQSCRLLLTG